MSEPVVEISHLKNYIGGNYVHQDVSFSIASQEIVAIIGGSGSGKTTILRSILLLLQPTAGEVKIFGQNIWQSDADNQRKIRQQMGMLFQQSALFSGLTVLENIMFPLSRLTHLPNHFIEELAMLKLILVGLEKKDAHKYPAELSGGMQKRAAAARAIALDPALLLLDEPVSGLDPKSAKAFDELLLFLRSELKLTILMVSHDIKSLERTTDKVVFIGDGKVLAFDSLKKVRANQNPMIQAYFDEK